MQFDRSSLPLIANSAKHHERNGTCKRTEFNLFVRFTLAHMHWQRLQPALVSAEAILSWKDKMRPSPPCTPLHFHLRSLQILIFLKRISKLTLDPKIHALGLIVSFLESAIIAE